ncbi:MAG: ATP cone domain-containing protein [Vulcanisaeta sp.]|jgi:transcriptional regulator NrdR family protein|nr:ATP cone domain-containing protein [Vulcanisaeta sp.]MCG2869849.1 ATP cone domain-containing protein [Vulcanisaeta sp.]MCG2880741.1 ATP cone domain-containing protein [Vulcanisaeta sp.]MCG2886967.1 ATP cone domain-containing protein [Vulcanisaeta sp.]
MVTKVIKRDGTEEDFIIEKIVVSILKTGAPVDVARRIARKIECQFADVDKVTAKDLTRAILSELRKINEEWYRNWIVFDRAVKRRLTEKELE